MIKLKRRGFLVIGLVTLAVLLPATAAYGQTPEQIVGMSIACSNDRVYTWFENGNVSIGTSARLVAHQPYEQNFKYALPPGKTPLDIVGIGIAGNDHVYAWYRDGTASSGTSRDLDRYRAPYRYSLAPGKTPADVVGIDIACSNDHVYVWYKDGTASSGTSGDLDKYRAPYSFSLAPGKSPTDVVGIGIAGNDHVYAWYRDRTVSSGTSSDFDQYRPSYSYSLQPPPACDIYTDQPSINTLTRVINGTGARGPSCDSTAEIVVTLKKYAANGLHKTLDEKRGRGTNFDVPVKYSCTGNGGLIVFVEVNSQGRKVRSKNVGIPYCY